MNTGSCIMCYACSVTILFSTQLELLLDRNMHHPIHVKIQQQQNFLTKIMKTGLEKQCNTVCRYCNQQLLNTNLGYKTADLATMIH